MNATTKPPAARTTVASAHLAASGASAISRMMAAVARQRSAGSTVIGMHVGEPDFDTPANIRAAAAAAIERGETHYTAFDGSPAMKDAVAAKYAKAGLTFGRDEIVVGAGAKLLLFAAFFATLEPGDEVIVPAPYWVSYVDIIKMMLAVPVIVETAEEDDFLLRPEALEAAITERTRWVMFNSPSNPSGAVYQRADYAAVLDVIARHQHVWVLADDMYEHIIYEGTDFVTPLEVRPGLRDRTLTINGVSKAYAMTGWRIGYAAGPGELMQLVGAVLSQSTSCASSVSQAASRGGAHGPAGRCHRIRQGLLRAPRPGPVRACDHSRPFMRAAQGCLLRVRLLEPLSRRADPVRPAPGRRRDLLPLSPGRFRAGDDPGFGLRDARLRPAVLRVLHRHHHQRAGPPPLGTRGTDLSGSCFLVRGFAAGFGVMLGGELEDPRGGMRLPHEIRPPDRVGGGTGDRAAV